MGSRILEWQNWRIGFSGVNKSVLGGLKRDSLTPPRRDLLTPPRATPPRLDLVDKTLQSPGQRYNNNRSRSRNSILTVECLEKLYTGWTITTRTPVPTANSLLQVSEMCWEELISDDCSSDIRLEYWDINELSPLSTPAVSRSPSPFDLQEFRYKDITNKCRPLYSLCQTLQISFSSDHPVPSPSQLPPPHPPEGQPHPHQGQELQQGAQAGPQLQERQREVLVQS